MPSCRCKSDEMCIRDSSNTLRDFSRTGSPNGSFGVLKIFESMEAGLPVLLSDVKCYREIVRCV